MSTRNSIFKVQNIYGGRNMKSKRVNSSILVFLMIFTLLPSNMNNVWAEETNISEMDADVKNNYTKKLQ